jgi:hypothetical protein
MDGVAATAVGEGRGDVAVAAVVGAGETSATVTGEGERVAVSGGGVPLSHAAARMASAPIRHRTRCLNIP